MIPALEAALAAEGLKITGAFHPTPADGAPEGTGTLCLIGADRAAMWARFRAAPEFGDGEPDPLDRWSRRVIEAIATGAGARAVFPFGGPPYQPFLRWGERAEGARPSPVGMLASAARGLWISWRGALALPERVAIPPLARGHPCTGCAAPCLSACPADAFADGSYDVARCAGHLKSDAGADCLQQGCRVRHVCPAGRGAAPPAAQCAFHMAAFLAARG